MTSTFELLKIAFGPRRNRAASASSNDSECPAEFTAVLCAATTCVGIIIAIVAFALLFAGVETVNAGIMLAVSTFCLLVAIAALTVRACESQPEYIGSEAPVATPETA